MMDGAVAVRRSLAEIFGEYEAKRDACAGLIQKYADLMAEIARTASIGGAYGGLSSFNRDEPTLKALHASLLRSAWRHVYDGFNLPRILGPHEKKRIDAILADPPAFTIPNIREAFGDYLLNPRHHILKGLAEIFANLDPAYKSHEKVKIGVAGLPKRVIITGFGSYVWQGEEQLAAIMNAVAAVEGTPLIGRAEVQAMRALAKDEAFAQFGFYLRKFGNGNGHLFFSPDKLRSVNRALGEFYGEVLPDTPDEDAGNGKARSTAVSKDLQYYPTPAAVVRRLCDDIRPGVRVLEPSCGCGRIMDAVRAAGATVLGYEVDPGRAEICRQKGHAVVIGNFLDQPPVREFDAVLMNPPFYGKHYAKHVLHAMKFLKPGGSLRAVLPITAKDHGLLPFNKRWPRESWADLPVGSFSESGTNVNTTIYSNQEPSA